MKTSNLITVVMILASSVLLSSCEVVGGIFGAGMGFGIFMILAVVVIAILFMVKLGKNKKP